ncbi:MAG: hypothetical protein JJ902_22680 [Roseibium sp.]|nr:hypothetical protein [Roseibium sp.]
MSRPPIDKLEMHRAVGLLTEELDKIGPINLRFSNDVSGLEAAHRILGKSETGENFQRAMDTLPPNRFFWIGAFMGDSVIGTVAARCDDSAWSLQRFVKEYWERTFDAEGGGKVSIMPDSPTSARNYFGRFAYLGEAVTRDDLRGKNLSYILVRLALLFAHDEWRPTVAYGWMRDWHAYAGLPIRWGFNRCVQNAFEWQTPPLKKDWHNLAFLLCDQDGFDQLMKHPAPRALFEARKNTQTGSVTRPSS